MWQIFTVTLRAFLKKFYDFSMFKKVVKMYKNYQEILKHNLVTAGLEPFIIWLSASRLRPLGHIHLFFQEGKIPLICCFESYCQSLLKLQAKTLVLTDANLNLDSFWLLFLDLQRVLIKDRFHNFYKLLPISSILPSYQNLLETDNNYD